MAIGKFILNTAIHLARERGYKNILRDDISPESSYSIL